MEQLHRRLVAIVLTLLTMLPLAACRPASAAAVPGSLEGTIAISGAFALYPMMVRWGEEFQKANPKVKVDVSAGGAGKGMADALTGAVDIGMVSRDVAPEEEAKGAYAVAVTKDAVFLVVNAKNPVLQDLLAKGISRDVSAGIYVTGDIKTWGPAVGRPEVTDEIHVYTRSDACGAGETWAKYLGKKQEALQGIGVYGDPGVLDAVIKDPLGIGYNNLNYAFDAKSGQPVAGAVVVPIDANGDGKAGSDQVLETKVRAVEAVASGRYPSPPARFLNLVTKGKPTGLVREFMLWILGDGQKYADEVGYVPLTKEQVAEALKKVQ